jgi:dihydrodipicolinate synthase/N-acetylneuraminate lyase
MDSETVAAVLQGCYVTIPTMFRDPDLEVDLDAIRRHVRFLIDGGLTTGNAVLLAGGAAGDFSQLSFDERVLIAEAVVEEAAGRVPIAMVRPDDEHPRDHPARQGGERIGADYLQVSPPFYFEHTEGDFEEHILAAAGAADCSGSSSTTRSGRALASRARWSSGWP